MLHNWLRKQDLTRREIFITLDMINRERNDGSIIPGTWRSMIENNTTLQNIATCSTYIYIFKGSYKNSKRDY